MLSGCGCGALNPFAASRCRHRRRRVDRGRGCPQQLVVDTRASASVSVMCMFMPGVQTSNHDEDDDDDDENGSPFTLSPSSPSSSSIPFRDACAKHVCGLLSPTHPKPQILIKIVYIASTHTSHINANSTLKHLYRTGPVQPTDQPATESQQDSALLDLTSVCAAPATGASAK